MNDSDKDKDVKGNYQKTGEELLKTLGEALDMANENKSLDHPGWDIGPFAKRLEATFSELGTPQPTKAEEGQGAAAGPTCIDNFDVHVPGMEDNALQAMLNLGIPAGLFITKEYAGSEQSSEKEGSNGKECDAEEDEIVDKSQVDDGRTAVLNKSF